MADTLAIPYLYESVVASMAADAAAEEPSATPVPHSFGWREPARQTASLRIVWVPGDDSSGRAGVVGPAKAPGRNPRPLATLAELVTVYLEAQDPTDPESEVAQYIAARFLFDAWFRAVYTAARGQFELVDVAWVDGRKQRRFGATMRVLVAMEAMIPDQPLGIAVTDAAGVFDVEELDHEEEFEVGTPPPYVAVATTAAIILSGEQSIDGQGVVAGDRVLVKDQADESENGVYVVALGAWSRASDADESAELPSGYFVHVQPGGTVNGDAGFELTTPDPIVLGTTELVFERVSP